MTTAAAILSMLLTLAQIWMTLYPPVLRAPAAANRCYYGELQAPLRCNSHLP